MTTVAKMTDLAVPNSAAVRQASLRGLYWQEWFAHGSELLCVLSIWLIGQWVLEIFFHPGWVLGWGIFLAVWLGAGFAGADAHEGAEEFALALPPTRGQRYRVRLLVSLSCLVFFVGTSLLAIGLNLPQKLWGLVAESGMTEPFFHESPQGVSEAYFYWLALTCCLAAFGVSFGLGAIACTREQVALAGLFGLLYTGAGMLVGYRLEMWLWPRNSGTELVLQGTYMFAVLVILAVVYLLAGYIGYRRKDGIARPRGSKSPEWRVAVVLAAVMLLGLLLMPVALELVPRW